MADETVEVVPVSIERVRDCYESARFWVRELPDYADRNQRLADWSSAAAGVLATITAASIIPEGNTLATAFLGISTGVLALIPRIFNFGERAGAARELTSRYGSVLGDLLDLTEARPFPGEAARSIVTEFEETKAKKDNLRGLPNRTTVSIRRLREAASLAEEELRTAEVRRKAAAAKAEA